MFGPLHANRGTPGANSRSLRPFLPRGHLSSSVRPPGRCSAFFRAAQDQCEQVWQAVVFFAAQQEASFFAQQLADEDEQQSCL